MIFNNIRLPDEVEIALDEGRLAVFVGAGISCPPPSNLPLFNGLASRIAGGKPVQTGMEDKLLGRLAQAGTDVHNAAAQILYNDNTSPTALHFEILRMFRTVDQVRIVTTNFDNHFSTAAAKLYRKPKLREFHAPALPIGDDFAGLIYLHGSARVEPSRLVLTDENFGAAYLTRGWARDFLVPLFSKYSVLFVGYSHNDVTISYLERGLKQSGIQPRWAFAASNDPPEARDNWQQLDIAIIEYQFDLKNVVNHHQALTEFFAEWAAHTNETVLKRAKRVKSIARRLPPESPAESEFLKHCLRHNRLAADFCEAIRHPAWFGWMNDHGYFKPFFLDDTSNKVEPNFVVARWLCFFVRKHHPHFLLDLIRSHHQRLSLDFSRTLAHRLWVDHSKSPDPLFATWVSILLSQRRELARDDLWADLLMECQIPQHLGVAIQLFELLTEPELRVKKSWSVSAKDECAKQPRSKVDYDILWPSEGKYWLSQAWQKLFRPNLQEIVEFVYPVVMRQLFQAHLLLRGVGRANEHFDIMNWSRSSIAPHEQDDDRFDETFSLLVDILREIFLVWMNHDSLRARSQADIWWSMKIPLFRRFAVYATSVDPQYSSDERIEWLLKHDIIFRSGMKKEVFDVLATAYPNVANRVRRRLIRRIERGYRGPGTKRLDSVTLDYEKFNVLVWLRRADPNCALVSNAINIIHLKNPDFAARDFPEFDHWHSKVGFVDPTTDFDFDQILMQPPQHHINLILSIGRRSKGHEVWDHLRGLSTLFSKNKEWGRQFMEALAKDVDVDSQIWNGVFDAWRETIKTDEDWNWILTIAEMLPKDAAILAGVANLISNRFWKDNATQDEVLIDRAASLIDRAWDACKDDTEPPDDSYRDWLTSAINHVGGWIGSFWVHYISNLRHRKSSAWSGIPKTLQQRIIEAIEGTTKTRVYSRIAMIPWLRYFFAWDRDFAVNQLLPLLDWQRDPIVAQQSWSVLLNYKHGTSLQLETILMPHYLQLITRMTEMLKGAAERSEQFDDHALHNLGFNLAGLVMHIIPNPIESGFFGEFLPLLPDKTRESLALGIGNHLEDFDNSKRQEIWNRWLRQYLDLRLVGVPTALTVGEAQNIFDWSISLEPVFPEAVDRLVRIRQGPNFVYGFLNKLLEKSSVEAFPRDTCRLINVALKSEDYPHLHPMLNPLHEKFNAVISGTPEFASFEELLYERGWKK